MGRRKRIGLEQTRIDEVHAAQYLRMSTERQKYSMENQAAGIARYAALNGLTVIRSYEDAGKSGLDLKGRAGLRQLLKDILDGDIPFQVLLVYDVSRWGRFQDTDESAYYEFLCKRAGVRIAYCAEPFDNDGTPLSTVLKSIKRAMAAEYSRELSNKVFVGQCRIVARGFNVGPSPMLGLRRMLVDQNGAAKGLLARGQNKAISTDRVILVPGPAKETALIRRIFHLFVEEDLNPSQIARMLNTETLPSPAGLAWRQTTVQQILRNEKYAGTNIYNRHTQKMKSRKASNPPEVWVRKVGAFKPVVDIELFDKARAKFESRPRRQSDEEMLARLKALFERAGTLRSGLINAEPDMRAAHVYDFRFGGLMRAYAMVGFSHTKPTPAKTPTCTPVVTKRLCSPNFGTCWTETGLCLAA